MGAKIEMFFDINRLKITFCLNFAKIIPKIYLLLNFNKITQKLLPFPTVGKENFKIIKI